MPIKDLEKRREYRREWYTKNKDSEKAHVSRRKKKIQIWFRKFKNDLKCSRCGEAHPATIDFHHTKEKEHGISQLVSYGYSISRIEVELKKCIVLCANCHRKEHYSE